MAERTAAPAPADVAAEAGARAVAAEAGARAVPAERAGERADDRAAIPPVVSILVVSYDTKAMTIDCIRSVIAETTLPHEIIVVDNASPDGSAAAIAEAFPPAAFPQVRLIASPVNLGFGAGNNRAAADARGEYLLLLNPDTVVLDRAIDRLVAFARAMPEARMWGGRTIFPDGSLNPQSCWELPSLWNITCRTLGLNALFPRSPVFNSESYPGWARDSVREVDMIIGCFLMTTRTLWDALGGFDEGLFMYGDDVDLCIRGRKLGARPHITPEATIIHYKGAADRVRADRMVRLLSAKVSVIQRHFTGLRRPLALGVLRLWPFTRMGALSLLAAVTRDPRFRDGRDNWTEIWRRRGVWWNGY